MALDLEAQALADEYRRIAETVQFNGVKLLNGTVSEIRLQVGIDGGSDSQLVASLNPQRGSLRHGRACCHTVRPVRFHREASWPGTTRCQLAVLLACHTWSPALLISMKWPLTTSNTSELAHV
jgi:hypothetical protein